MHYVMSDIHGQYQKYLQMLKLIDLKDTDTLYILGDVIDRGPENIAMLREVMQRKNIVFIKGNHEYIMYHYYVTTGPIVVDQDFWYENGGYTTDVEFRNLPKTEQNEILQFIKNIPIQLEIEVNGVEYLLVHGKSPSHLRCFEPGHYKYELDILEGRMSENTRLPKGKTVIFGHTQTHNYQDTLPYAIWYGQKKIGIDCGMANVPKGNIYSRLACLRLEDMKEFYV